MIEQEKRPPLEKLSTETPLEYHSRLVRGKIVDKSLSDYDYSELAEKCYGKRYASDVARRMLYGSSRTLDLVESDPLFRNSGSISKKNIEAQIVELQKERRRLSDQRREYNKIISAWGRAEHLHDCIIEAAGKIDKDIGTLFTEKDHNVEADKQLQNEAVLVFSDWHYGMKASNIFNEFDREICKKRVKTIVDKAVDKIKLHKCRAAHVVILGDMFHGATHVSARVASDELVCEQIMHVAEIIAQSIAKISGYVDNTYVYMTYGNHARTVANKKDSIHRDNLERIINWWLVERFRGHDNIQIVPEFDNEFITMKVCGHGFCASHGDLDSVSGSPRLCATLFQKKYGIDIEYILLGDKHHRESFDELGITAMMCGSLCGTDDYANDRRLYSAPSQLLCIVNPDVGIDAEYRLKC